LDKSSGSSVTLQSPLPQKVTQSRGLGSGRDCLGGHDSTHFVVNPASFQSSTALTSGFRGVASAAGFVQRLIEHLLCVRTLAVGTTDGLGPFAGDTLLHSSHQPTPLALLGGVHLSRSEVPSAPAGIRTLQEGECGAGYGEGWRLGQCSGHFHPASPTHKAAHGLGPPWVTSSGFWALRVASASAQRSK
jgi:hypothetical protein